MKELTRVFVPLETVTPTWMGGASSQPELRPPTVRGCLRFWLRALLGGTLGEDLPSLRAAEGAVFGSVTRASPIVVRLDGSPEIGPATVSAEDFPGTCYMYWSTYQRKRDAILPGQTCRMQLHNRAWDFPDEEVQGKVLRGEHSFHYAAAALWLLLRLGGVGARVRRGGGILRTTEQPTGWPESVPSPLSRAATPDQLAAELSDGLNAIRQSVPWHTAAPATVSSFDNNAVLETGITVHPVFGFPVIPGSCLKGVTRSYALHLAEEPADHIDIQFGWQRDEQSGCGNLVFLEAGPVAPPSIERDVVSPIFGAYYQGDSPPAGYLSPTPFFFLALGRHSRYQFGVASLDGDRQAAEEGSRWLQAALEQIGIGAKTAAGYGFWTIEPEE